MTAAKIENLSIYDVRIVDFFSLVRLILELKIYQMRPDRSTRLMGKPISDWMIELSYLGSIEFLKSLQMIFLSSSSSQFPWWTHQVEYAYLLRSIVLNAGNTECYWTKKLRPSSKKKLSVVEVWQKHKFANLLDGLQTSQIVWYIELSLFGRVRMWELN